MATEDHTPLGRGYLTSFGYFHHDNGYWGEDGHFRIVRGVDECEIESHVTATSAGATWARKSEL